MVAAPIKILSTYFPDEKLSESEWFNHIGIVVPFSSKYKPNGNSRDIIRNDNPGNSRICTPVVQEEERNN